MAASDPATDVPTPTGVLQGVAAFSWDGAAWQPSGRAGPSVATPTGVLRGVAPFTGSGTSWTPAGRAQPGVPTPSGVLDGVAVYTWSGAAWTPPGGQSTPATPTGTLRGVAAFNWDGAAWQPAAQAGAEVATPYGVLDGVAMFNWSGSAWAAVGAPSLSLDFMQPGTLDPRITFTRASTGTYFDSAGVMQTVATNAPRWDYDPATRALRGLLIEEARTNVIKMSGNPADATWWSSFQGTVAANVGVAPDGTTTAAQITSTGAPGGRYSTFEAQTSGVTYSSGCFVKWISGPTTLRVVLAGQSVFGGVGGDRYVDFNGQTGAFVGKHTDVTAYTITQLLNGWWRVSGTYTPTGNSSTGVALYAAASGTVFQGWGGQIEVGAFATSYIPTTIAPVTRAADIASMPVGAWFNASASTLFGEFIYPRPIDAFNAHDLAVIGNNVETNGNHLTLRATDGGAPPLLPKVNTGIGAGGATLAPTGTPDIGGIARLAGAWSGTASFACLNGNAVTTIAAGMPAGLTTLVIGNRTVGGTGSPLNGYIRAVRYWPRVLTNAEMQSVTA